MEPEKISQGTVISDIKDLKKKRLEQKTKKEHSIMIKELIQEEDIMLINKCTPNTGSPQYKKK